MPAQQQLCTDNYHHQIYNTSSPRSSFLPQGRLSVSYTGLSHIVLAVVVRSLNDSGNTGQTQASLSFTPGQLLLLFV